MLPSGPVSNAKEQVLLARRSIVDWHSNDHLRMKDIFFRVSLHGPATRDLRVTNACTVGDSGLFAWYFEKLSSLNIVLAQLKDLFP